MGNTRSSRHQPREGSKGVDGTRLPSNRENCHPGGSANRIVGCAHRTPILPVPRASTDVFIYYICDWVGKYSRLDRESVCHFENERRASLRVTAAAAAAFVVVVVVVVAAAAAAAAAAAVAVVVVVVVVVVIVIVVVVVVVVVVIIVIVATVVVVVVFVSSSPFSWLLSRATVSSSFSFAFAVYVAVVRVARPSSMRQSCPTDRPRPNDDDSLSTRFSKARNIVARHRVI